MTPGCPGPSGSPLSRVRRARPPLADSGTGLPHRQIWPRPVSSSLWPPLSGVTPVPGPGGLQMGRRKEQPSWGASPVLGGRSWFPWV